MPDLEELTGDECWERLRESRLGRLAVVHDGQPEIFPVNFTANAGQLVFRTEAGGVLARAAGRRAALEIDEFDETAGGGWSVMARGTVQDIDETIDALSESLRQLEVHPAAPGARHHWMALYVEAVSGRRFRAPGG